MSDDVRQLAADIDAVLAPRPGGPGRGSARWLGSAWTAPPPEIDWLVESDPRCMALGCGSEDAAGWMRKARRQRWANRMRNAVSWTIALALGSAIVGLCTAVLLGRLPGAGDLIALVQKLRF